jgi:phosphoribosyl 1,2-cyclic phosphodiesterase
MSLFIASINSGSNANCYYIANDTEAILVDTGLSLRETEKRMTLLGLSMDKVKAIFISHEHSDHITGLPAISKKYQLPVFITDATYKNSNLPVEEHLLTDFDAGKPIAIDGLTVTPFRKHHDAADPYSFIITNKGTTVGVLTDIGFACKQTLKYFAQCHAVFLEANYCEEMLENGNYPYHLKNRISSDSGHLSNRQALELFQQYKSPDLQLLILSHLSKNNNSPDTAAAVFAPHAGSTKVVVASRYEASPVYEIRGTVRVMDKRKVGRKNENQLSLF